MVTKHRPKHINQTKNPYFVTGRTYFGLPYFDTDEKKELALLSAIHLACKNYHLTLDGWTILDNHYHLLFRPPGCNWELGIADKSASSEIADKSATSKEDEVARSRAIEIFKIGKVMGTIHGKSSSLLKKIAAKAATSEDSIAGKPATSEDSIAGKPATSNLTRNSNFSCDKRIAGKSATSETNRGPYTAWWDIKYWEEIKRESITLYGKRSQLAEKKRAEEFNRLLKEIADKSATSKESRNSDFSRDPDRDSELARASQKLIDFIKKTDRVWYQYADHVIRDERDYYMHLNYTHQNCVKHGYVKNMWGYRFSSVHEYDKDRVADCFREYPIKDFEPEMGDFV